MQNQLTWWLLSRKPLPHSFLFAPSFFLKNSDRAQSVVWFQHRPRVFSEDNFLCLGITNERSQKSKHDKNNFARCFENGDDHRRVVRRWLVVWHSRELCSAKNFKRTTDEPPTVSKIILEIPIWARNILSIFAHKVF